MRKQGKDQKSVRYFLTEGALIVFSILLALVVNEWRIRAGEASETKKAVADILAELTENRQLLEGVADYHRAVGQALNKEAASLDSNDARRPIVILRSLEVLKPTAIVARFPKKVSWQLARDRGVVARFNFDLAKTLSETYDNQIDSVITLYDDISDLLFLRRDMFMPREQTSTLAPLAETFNELAGREELLVHLLDKSIKHLKEEYPHAIAHED